MGGRRQIGQIVGNPFLQDDREIDTSGAAIELDMAMRKERKFTSSDDITDDVTVSVPNDANATEFDWYFTLDDAHTLTLPDAFVMSDAKFNNATKKWAAEEAGDYMMHAVKFGSTWRASISGPDNA